MSVRKCFLPAVGMFFVVKSFAAQTVCPETITCDWDTGICNQPSGLHVGALHAKEPFVNETFVISKIKARRYWLNSPSWVLDCIYSYGKSSYIVLIAGDVKLEGIGWSVYGFGKSKARCTDLNNLSECAGIENKSSQKTK